MLRPDRRTASELTVLLTGDAPLMKVTHSVEEALLEGRPVSPGTPYGESLA